MEVLGGWYPPYDPTRRWREMSTITARASFEGSLVGHQGPAKAGRRQLREHMAGEVPMLHHASAAFALAVARQMRLTGKNAEYRWQLAQLRGGVCGVWGATSCSHSVGAGTEGKMLLRQL